MLIPRYCSITGGVPRQSRRSDDKRRKVCLLLIFKYLNAIELCGVARVCREWREMSEHPALWKNVILEDMPLNNMVRIEMSEGSLSQKIWKMTELLLISWQALQAVSRKCSSMQFLKLKGILLLLNFCILLHFAKILSTYSSHVPKTYISLYCFLLALLQFKLPLPEAHH